MDPRLIRKDQTVYDVLTQYPQLKRIFQELSPKYKKLDNPVAFNTLARITTLERAAKIGGVYLRELLYRLNEELGLGKEYLAEEKKALSESLRSGEALKKVTQIIEKRTSVPISESGPPSWIEQAQGFPNMDLRTLGEDPFDRVMKLASGMQKGEGFILIQSFEPLPLISHLSQKGFSHYTKREKANEYWIYLIKTH